MNKKIILTAIVVLSLSLFYSCDEENVTTTTSSSSSSTTTSNTGKSFSLTYKGITYKGSSVNFVEYPETGNPKYKNRLTATSETFSIAIFNIPASGLATLKSGIYDATVGDIALTMTMLSDYSYIGGFNGTINRTASNKLTLNSNYSNQALTGTIEW